MQCKADVHLLGRVRRSDWLPVGGDPRGNEQTSPGRMSWSDSEESSCSSSHSNEDQSTDSEEPSDDELNDPTAWNNFQPRVWDDPCDDADSDGSEHGFRFKEDNEAEDQQVSRSELAGLFD